MKVIFMGTPDFAVNALEGIHASGFEIALVITQPDKPKGRGRKLVPTPVKQSATNIGCRIEQPENINHPDVIALVTSLKPDIIVVVAYGQILSEKLLHIPKYGSVNIHGSLLPAYRGPAPIHRSIVNGDKITGVTTMMMEKTLDTGDILMQEEVEISANDTAGSLHDKLAEAGARLITQTLIKMQKNAIIPVPQRHENMTYAHLLHKKEGHINWGMPASQLDCFIRGMTPWPGAYTYIDGKRVKIFSIAAGDDHAENAKITPGLVLSGYKNKIAVLCSDRLIFITELQGSSGKRMTAEAFLRGNTIKDGTILK
jgi:methionyl-tRNA formyltransferase